MIKSLKDLLDKFSRFTNSLVYDGGICKRLFKDDKNIPDIIESHSKTNPKFTKKNHERNENLEDKQLGMWYAGLLRRIQ